MNIRKPQDSDLDRADHTAHGLQVVRDRGYGTLRNYGDGDPVHVAWHLGEKAKSEGIFKIKIGEETAYVNLEEMQRLLRWV